MSAATHLSQTAMSASTRLSAAPAPLDADRAKDLYAIWKSVFERSRPVAASRDARHLPGSDTRRLQWEFSASRDARASSMQGDDAAESARAAAAASGIGSTEPAAVSAARSRSTEHQRARNLDAAAQLAPSTTNLDGMDGRMRSDAARTRSGAATAPQTIATQMPSVATESLNVFVQGATVAIVVRDAQLSDEGALQCAFETARALTGQRAGLRQLTLNGRTVYQQQPEALTPSALRVCELVFAC